MESEAVEILQRLGAEHRRVSGLTPSSIWAAAAKDAHFLKRVESTGQTFTVRTLSRAIQWFSDNWPDGAMWPDGVKRPERTPANMDAAE